MSLFCAVEIYPTTPGRITAGHFHQEVLPLAKTMLNVISVFDGTEDATDVFVSLIARKISGAKQPRPSHKKYTPQRSYGVS